MAHRTPILVGHLEKVSWTVMQEYPDVIRKLIKGNAGIYALYRGERLYYVGLASNLMRRIKTHLVDRHNGAWNRFSVYITARNEHIKELESLLLRIMDPAGNRMSGRLRQSHNLKRDLNQGMKSKDADRRAHILGGSIATRHRRSKARKAAKKAKLENLIDQRYALRGWLKEYEYRASLRQDGTIRYGARVFDTPTAAASSAVGRRVNGWSFWHIRDKKTRDWLPLRTLKK